MAFEQASSPGDPSGEPHRYQPQHVPAAVGTFGLWLFLASLFMLFGAVMIGYVFIRLARANGLPPGSIHLPDLLWLSTALVIGVSVALGRSLYQLRIERQQSFKHWLNASLLLGAAFLVVQAPAMVMLLSAFGRSGAFVYRLIFVLVLLHALHVVGGMVALVRVVVRGSRGVYDHEHYLPVRHVVVYWHFLDVVWITMFTTFLLTR